ncbi:phage major capsid protein [Dermacoccus nishinomiyaensis]|uniref:phage major capsid protein n=1 Tax=Dermacoccus nishinomiyaensis TaxID=1274 RepID=UPI00248D3FF1|nr:phage major capsid protein [Dermacoccus nishinomiyaensis]
MALDSTSNATELTAEQVSTVLVQPLADRSVFLSSGVQIIDTAGPLRLPLGAGSTSPQWYGQNEQISDDDPSFDEITLLPTTMKSVKVMTRFSNELARQSVVALDAALRARLVQDVADVIDAQLLGAGGDGVEKPRGLFAYPGTQAVAVDGPLSLDHLVDAEGMALAENVSEGSLAWVMTPREFTALRKVKDTSERYQLQPDPTRAGGFTLFGHRVIVTKRVPDTAGATPTGRAALVDFSQVVVARDASPSVKILDQTYGDFDQQAIRVVARYDAAPVKPEAVVKLTGIEIV